MVRVFEKFTMKKVVLFAALLVPTMQSCDPKTLQAILETPTTTTPAPLTNDEVIRGLKQALEKGAQLAVSTVSVEGGFNNNSLIKIPFPAEAAKVKETALNLGLSSQVAKFEDNLNKAAELASKEATNVLVNAITDMTVADGFAILRGEENAATSFLRKNTEDELRAKFGDIVQSKIDEVKLTSYWEPLAKAYNTSTLLTGGQAINPDLEAYVTQKALDGLFVYVAKEEKNIRANPAARTTELLTRVFGSINR